MTAIIAGLWFLVALSCLVLFWLLRGRFRHAPMQEQAQVVCSACGYALSGLERVCPNCQKWLVYAVRSRPESPIP